MAVVWVAVKTSLDTVSLFHRNIILSDSVATSSKYSILRDTNHVIVGSHTVSLDCVYTKHTHRHTIVF